MAKTTFKLRVDDEELGRWKLEAEAAGRSLSGWVRWRCDGRDVGLVVSGVLGAAEREGQKISKPGVEVEQRSVARRTGTIRAIEDLTHAVARKHLEPKSGLPTCRHGREQGANCWQCRGIAEVEAPKKAKGRGRK